VYCTLNIDCSEGQIEELQWERHDAPYGRNQGEASRGGKIF